MHNTVSLKLYDVTGKLSEQQQSTNDAFVISKNNRSGMYFYELLFTNGLTYRGKVMFAEIGRAHV